MKQEKLLRRISLSNNLDEVQVDFIIVSENQSENEDSAPVKPYVYKVKGPHRPHKDLVDSMKKLRKHAFALNEMTVDSTQINTWTVCELKIDGDYLQKQSRATMKLAHMVKRTKKVVKMPVGPVTMYPKQDENVPYVEADKMTEIIEDIIEEAFSYLGGKTEETGQVPLFPSINTLKVA